MKKIIGLLLALCMTFTMSIGVGAYSDVEKSTYSSEAITILSNLGIFNGFEDGSFKPNDAVTRAQMAKIICQTLEYGEQAVASAGSTIFTDVPANHWASGYINVAQSLDIIEGYGNGNFGPEDKVTYEQAIKMIVVALGYELDAQAKGGWSTGYLAVASREGITKSANGIVGTPATRDTIAVLVYNALEVRLMDQKSWTSSGDNNEFGKLDETILSQYLGIRKVEGIVTETPFSNYAANGYTEDADIVMAFADGAEYFEYYNGKMENYGLDQLEYDASLIADINNYTGKKVVAYVGEEEDDETGNLMVYAIAEKQGANKVTVISAAQLVDDSYADKYYAEAGTIAYTAVGSSKVTSLDLEDVAGIPVYKNFVYDKDVTMTSDFDDDINGTITFISNDADSKIDLILVTAYEAEAVVEDVETEDGIIMFNLYHGNLEDIDTEDEDVLNAVVKDGVVATVADITANDTVSYIDVAGDGSFMLYYVSSKTVTGKVSTFDDEYVVISGEEYELSTAVDAAYNDTADLKGQEGIFFLNVDGQIAWAEASAENNYGVIIGVGVDGRKYGIEVVLADGTVATYELKDKLTFNDMKVEDEEAATELAILMSNEDFDWYTPNGSEVENLVFDIQIKDGKVKELTALNVDGDATDKEYDEENMAYGNISFNKATIIISVETEEDKEVEASDIKVGKVSDFFIDGEGEDFVITAYDYDNNDIAGLVIGKNLTTTIAKNGSAFIFTGYSSTEYDEEDAFIIKGFQNGKKVSYVILEEDADDAGINIETLDAGDVLLLGAVNAEGIITDAELLYTDADGIVAVDDDEDEEYYIFGDLVEDPKPTSSKFFLENIEGTYYDAADGIVMRNSANYTLVDFSESRKPEVSKKSKGTGLFTRLDDYTYKVFVRYYEDSLVEVIIYKY